MESLLAQLLGMGLATVAVTGMTAVVSGMILPIWAIIDCAISDRDGAARALGLLIIGFTWSLGAFLYAIFTPGSRLSGSSRTVLFAEAFDGFKPDDLPHEKNPEPFMAILCRNHGVTGPGSSSLATFSWNGADLGSASPLGGEIRQVDQEIHGDIHHGITSHDLMKMEPASGKFTRVEVDPALRKEFSWPTGIAWDKSQKKFLIMPSHVYAKFFTYDPAASTWARLGVEIRGPFLVGLTRLPSDGLFYSVEYGTMSQTKSFVRALHRFNRSGADLGALTLVPPIPMSEYANPVIQIKHSGPWLVLILAPMALESPVGSNTQVERDPRLFAVDPKSGKVFQPIPEL